MEGGYIDTLKPPLLLKERGTMGIGLINKLERWLCV
jgi:hypothetical protein